jgi:hypothetical protein
MFDNPTQQVARVIWVTTLRRADPPAGQCADRSLGSRAESGFVVTNEVRQCARCAASQAFKRIGDAILQSGFNRKVDADNDVREPRRNAGREVVAKRRFIEAT